MPISHTVKEGESVSSIAARYGFFDRTLWDLPENAALKKLRTNPNVLLPGDIVFVPDKRPATYGGPTGGRHVFRRKGIPCIFRLRLFAGDQPRRNQQYELRFDRTVRKGVTNDQGVLSEFLPPETQQGRLTIGPDRFECVLQFGFLDPETEFIGVQKRLWNLGFDCGVCDGSPSEKTTRALLAFQRHYGLDPTGKPDAATIAKIKTLHDTAAPLASPQDGPGSGPKA
jgi:hypothetical protein